MRQDNRVAIRLFEGLIVCSCSNGVEGNLRRACRSNRKASWGEDDMDRWIAAVSRRLRVTRQRGIA